MVTSIGSFLASIEVVRGLLIAGAILGIAMTAYFLAKKRNGDTYLSMFIYWFCYLNLFVKFTYLFY
jgi:hypothetical protein